MPNLQYKKITSGNRTWLDSTDGLAQARTEVLKVADFEDLVDDYGYLPSGTPVAVVTGKCVPYAQAEGTTTGAGVLAGFTATDQRLGPDPELGVPVLWRGVINVKKLPKTFVPPVAVAKRANTFFKYVNV